MTKLAALALIAALFAGCGSATRTAPNGSAVSVVDSTCAGRIKPLYDAERDLNSRLSVGLNKSAYSDRLGSIRVEYDKAVAAGPFDEGACIDTAKKLQKRAERVRRRQHGLGRLHRDCRLLDGHRQTRHADPLVDGDGLCSTKSRSRCHDEGD